MLANILIKYFIQGGPIMWPILIAPGIVAVAVVGERTFWWLRESRRRDPGTLSEFFRHWKMAILAKHPNFPKIRKIP